MTARNDRNARTALTALTALAALAAAAALVVLWPDVARTGRDLSAPGPRITSVGADRFVAQLAGGALWLLAAWVAVGLLTVGGAQLPGACGRLSGQLGRIVVPRVIASLLAGSAGVGVLLAPVAAGAVPSPVWPSAPAPHSSSSSAPAPVWPSTVQPATPSPAPASRPSTGHRTAPAGPGRDAAAERVQPGDSLWLLAARRLGPDATTARVAAYWPQIYAANRHVIGADPSLITPGQRLTEPVPTSQEPTS
jgi:hypothetical protein